MFGSEDMNTGSLSLGLNSWGTPAPSGGSGGGFDFSTITDPWQQYQARSMERQFGLQEQQLGLMGQVGQPSKLSTGLSNFGMVTQGIGDLASIYFGLQGMKLQKDAFKFNKGVTNTNLGNAITDYNRRLNDTLANRALNMGGGAAGDAYVSDQLAKFSAKRSG